MLKAITNKLGLINAKTVAATLELLDKDNARQQSQIQNLQLINFNLEEINKSLSQQLADLVGQAKTKRPYVKSGKYATVTKRKYTRKNNIAK